MFPLRPNKPDQNRDMPTPNLTLILTSSSKNNKTFIYHRVRNSIARPATNPATDKGGLYVLRFGPGGIPLSCKGRTLKDGVYDTFQLGLNAMEFQMVRMNIVERDVKEKEIGVLPKEVEGEIIVEVYRKRKKGKGYERVSLEEPLRRGDMVATLVSNVARDHHELADIARLAEELDVQLSVHAPYYMELLSPSKEARERSLFYLRCTAEIAKALHAKVITTHIGFYGPNRENAVNDLVETLRPFVEWMIEERIGAKLGLETSGKQEIFGTVEEVAEAARQLKNTIPVLNFPHIHAREGGTLISVEAYGDLFSRIRRAQQNNFYGHFSGVEHSGGNEKRYTPIKKGDQNFKFERLAEFLLEHPYNITLISSSPLLEHDAVYMRVIYERLGARKVARIIREEIKKAEEEKKKEKEQKKEKEKERAEKKKKDTKKKENKSGGSGKGSIGGKEKKEKKSEKRSEKKGGGKKKNKKKKGG